MFFTLLPFQGVDDLLFVTQGVASLTLGKELIGLSARSCLNPKLLFAVFLFRDAFGIRSGWVYI